MADKNKPAAKVSNGREPEGNVDQIRDILFGGQMRDYERRFEELADQLKREAERVRMDLGKRLDNLEAYAKDQHESLQSQLKKLSAEAKANNEEQGERNRDLGKAVRAEISELESKVESGNATLRDRLLKLANDTAEQLRKLGEEQQGQLGRVGSELREDKVSRDELAGFFSEVALRLNRQFDLPSG